MDFRQVCDLDPEMTCSHPDHCVELFQVGTCMTVNYGCSLCAFYTTIENILDPV